MAPEPFATLSTRKGFPMAAHVNYKADYEDGEMPRSVAELEIMQLAGAIRDKPNWWIKVFDAEIISRWKEESLQVILEEGGEEEKRRLQQFSYALQECQWQAQHYPGPSRPAAIDSVFARDDLDPELLERLLTGIRLLRSNPAIGTDHEDRHPGTPQMVDLVHPSMYAYHQGVTPALPQVGAEMTSSPPWEDFLGLEGVPEKPRPPSPDDIVLFMSSPLGLQWLPSEFFVSKKSDESLTCSINSYINSLHPKEYPELYDLIGDLFCHALPVLDDVLSDIGQGVVPRERELRVPVDCYGWYSESAPRDQLEGEGDNAYDAYVDSFYENRPIKPIAIPDFEPPKWTKELVKVDLINRPLQVIVKIASLELQPGESYRGGTWHVEGMVDERIVATACCYLESDNVNGGELEFRTAVAEPDYEQNDNRGVALAYNLHSEESLIQPRGQASTIAGRVLAWPNTLQHRVKPVRLQDASRPGKRTILCFFLVDPTLRVRSTATVPPQQRSWLINEMQATMGQMIAEAGVTEKIGSFLPRSMLTYEEACQRREQLMDERRQVTHPDGEETFFERQFSLCEH